MTQETNLTSTIPIYFVSPTGKIHATSCRHCQSHKEGWQKLDSFASGIEKGYQACRLCCPSDNKIQNIPSNPIISVPDMSISEEKISTLTPPEDKPLKIAVTKVSANNEVKVIEEGITPENLTTKTSKDKSTEKNQSISDKNKDKSIEKIKEKSEVKTDKSTEKSQGNSEIKANKSTDKTQDKSIEKNEDKSEVKADKSTEKNKDKSTEKSQGNSEINKDKSGDKKDKSKETQKSKKSEPPEEKKRYKILAGNGCHQAIAEVQGILVPPSEPDQNFLLILPDGFQIEVTFKTPRLHWIAKNQDTMLGAHWFRGYPKMKDDKLISLQIIAWDKGMPTNPRGFETWEFTGVWTAQRNITVQRSMMMDDIRKIAKETGFIKKFKYTFINSFDWVKNKKLWMGYVYKILCQRRGDTLEIKKVIPYACPRYKPDPKGFVKKDDNKNSYNKGDKKDFKSTYKKPKDFNSKPKDSPHKEE
jgi:hypothetical protein